MPAARTGVDDPVVVVVDGELDASDVDWTDELRSLLTAGRRHVVVDMLGVSFIDSSVVRELVDTFRALSGTGWLRIVYTHHLIRRVIAICGLADALPQYTSVDAALRGTPSALRPDDSHGYRELDVDDPSADTDRPGPAHRGSAPR